MNVFVLSTDPATAAREHCDKHVVKMILEYAQLLSAAHRLCDGRQQVIEFPDGKKQRVYLFEGEVPTVVAVPKPSGGTRYKVLIENPRCYALSHAQHPCAKWARLTTANYTWLSSLLIELLAEYERRYHKRHTTSRLVQFLSVPPKNVLPGPLTTFPQAMPDEYKHEDTVEAYRRLYAGAKVRFARWTQPAEVPSWFTARTGGDPARFTRPPRADKAPAVRSRKGREAAASQRPKDGERNEHGLVTA